MRIEESHLFIVGTLLFIGLWLITRSWSSNRIQLQLRAISFSLLVGAIVEPGHGEIVIVPILAVITSPWQPLMLGTGSFYFLFWWALALFIFKTFKRSSIW